MRRLTPLAWASAVWLGILAGIAGVTLASGEIFHLALWALGATP